VQEPGGFGRRCGFLMCGWYGICFCLSPGSGGDVLYCGARERDAAAASGMFGPPRDWTEVSGNFLLKVEDRRKRTVFRSSRERYNYGGLNATVYFCLVRRSARRVPVTLSRWMVTAQFTGLRAS